MVERYEFNSASAPQRRPGRAGLVVAAAVAIAASSAVASAQATEVCVECAAPDKSYVCQIDKAEKLATFQAGLQALQYLCVTELARIGPHGRCKARRNADNCLGTIHIVSIAEARRALSGAPAPAEQPKGATVPAPASGQPAAALQAQSATPVQPAPAPGDKSQPPRTMKELAERTLDASGKQAKDAGDAVTTGVAKTWKCVVTLFQKC